MTRTGNLVEVAKEPVDVVKVLEESTISDSAKELIRCALGG
nr:MAG: hypothetical protein [Bacteriophage sp.]